MLARARQMPPARAARAANRRAAARSRSGGVGRGRREALAALPAAAAAALGAPAKPARGAETAVLTRTKLSPRPDGSVGVDFVDVEYRPNGVAAAALLFEDGRDKPVGAVAFREFESGDGDIAVRTEVTLRGGQLPAGTHALQLHTTKSATSSGFNPRRRPHGAPDAVRRTKNGLQWDRHVGDLGNVELAADGSDFSLATYDPLTTLRGKESVVGRCIAVHRNADDFSGSWEPSAVLASGVVELLA